MENNLFKTYHQSYAIFAFKMVIMIPSFLHCKVNKANQSIFNTNDFYFDSGFKHELMMQ